ncbi:hypothetical protein [Olsenella uli]|nr:hypothetical protein [Olsenella uli]
MGSSPRVRGAAYVSYLKQIQAMCGVQVTRDEGATSALARQRRESPLAR